MEMLGGSPFDLPPQVAILKISQDDNTQGHESWLLVGSGIGFQIASKISLERTVCKI